MRSRTSNGTTPRECGGRGFLRFFFTCFSSALLSRARGRQVLCERQVTNRHIAGEQHSRRSAEPALVDLRRGKFEAYRWKEVRPSRWYAPTSTPSRMGWFSMETKFIGFLTP